MLHGALPAERVAALMRDASFAVVPSRYETFSVVASEALACGLPVVATAAGALPERIHAGNGLLCPPRDPRALADAIERMLGAHGGFDRAAIAGRGPRRSSRPRRSAPAGRPSTPPSPAPRRARLPRR